MPFRLEVSASEDFARVTATGRIEFDEIYRHMTEVRRRGINRLPELIDVTRAEAVSFTMRDFLEMAKFAYGQFSALPMAPRAVLVGSRKHFEWARMFAGLVAGWMPVGVFTDRREAMLWLEHRTAQQEERRQLRRVAAG